MIPNNSVGGATRRAGAVINFFSHRVNLQWAGRVTGGRGRADVRPAIPLILRSPSRGLTGGRYKISSSNPGEAESTNKIIIINSMRLAQKSKICWLDLRRSGLSVVERLVIEEALLRHDPQQRQWAISTCTKLLRLYSVFLQYILLLFNYFFFKCFCTSKYIIIIYYCLK
jgi:hypothetical protein